MFAVGETVVRCWREVGISYPDPRMTGRSHDVKDAILEWTGYKVLSSADYGSRSLIQGVGYWMKGG
jgi:hypothetical protein